MNSGPLACGAAFVPCVVDTGPEPCGAVAVFVAIAGPWPAAPRFRPASSMLGLLRAPRISRTAVWMDHLTCATDFVAGCAVAVGPLACELNAEAAASILQLKHAPSTRNPVALILDTTPVPLTSKSAESQVRKQYKRRRN